MPDPVVVVIDTNNISRLHSIDGNCDLIDFIVDTFGSHGVADLEQLRRKTCCTHLPDVLRDHGTTDAEVASFVVQYSGKCSLERIMEDPADLRLLVCALKNVGSTLISCDKRLLMLAADTKQNHVCFKAAIHEVDLTVGGLFSDDGYKTEAMFDTAGNDPFFHYCRNSKCEVCDPGKRCQTRLAPPSRN